jgi:hypothetical protein
VRSRGITVTLVLLVAAIVVAVGVAIAVDARNRGSGDRGFVLRTAPAPSFAALPSGDAILVGAGDIASCGSDADEATARLLDAIPGTVFAAGDDAYERGTADEFGRCYDPTWGRVRDRTLPAPGNHDYGTSGAAGYVGYFGARARPSGTTWYSREVGAWHVIVLDSDCSAVGGCGAGSAQERWLRADLAASGARCTIAIWHHPLFSSGEHGNNADLTAFWNDLYAAGADIVVNGHDHDYERFAPQAPDGRSDRARGIREFVVGTGGAALRAFGRVRPNSEVRNASTHGVLRLTLGADGYDWTFVPVAGESFTDSGSGDCH